MQFLISDCQAKFNAILRPKNGSRTANQSFAGNKQRSTITTTKKHWTTWVQRFRKRKIEPKLNEQKKVEQRKRSIWFFFFNCNLKRRYEPCGWGKCFNTNTEKKKKVSSVSHWSSGCLHKKLQARASVQRSVYCVAAHRILPLLLSQQNETEKERESARVRLLKLKLHGANRKKRIKWTKKKKSTLSCERERCFERQWKMTGGTWPTDHTNQTIPPLLGGV